MKRAFEVDGQYAVPIFILNGFEVLKWVKGQPTLKTIPVMVLTAKGQDQDRRTAEGLGVDAFVTKPFSNREIVDHVQRLIDA